VISEPHRMIHDGYFYDVSGIVTGVANGATMDLMVRRPAGNIGHLTNIEITLDDAPVTITFHEDVTVSADGTEKTVRNHNRLVGDNGPGAQFFEQPTVTGTGTLLHERYIPSPAAPGATAAGSLVKGEDHEWIIGSPTEQTQYLWRVTNNSGGAITIGYHFNGYVIPTNPG
jgi:hypothetical protein